MKLFRTRTAAAVLLSLAMSLGILTGVGAEAVKTAFSPAVDVYTPKNAKGALPAIFLAHNGGASKESWKDYAESLANEGYLVASITWKSFDDNADLSGPIKDVLSRYRESIDPGRTAFVGGCHGAVKFTRILNSDPAASRFKALVFLSISEDIQLPKKHVPILALYANADHLGAYYVNKSRSICEEQITEPVRRAEIQTIAHGNEMVTLPTCSVEVRKMILSWLKQNLK